MGLLDIILGRKKETAPVRVTSIVFDDTPKQSYQTPTNGNGKKHRKQAKIGDIRRARHYAGVFEQQIDKLMDTLNTAERINYSALSRVASKWQGLRQKYINIIDSAPELKDDNAVRTVQRLDNLLDTISLRQSYEIANRGISFNGYASQYIEPAQEYKQAI